MEQAAGQTDRQRNQSESKRRDLFSRIYEGYRQPLDSYLKGYCRDTEIRCELIQETFIRIYRGLSSYKPEQPLKPYIYRIARNTAIDYFRSRSRKERAMEMEWPETGIEADKYRGPELLSERKEEAALLRSLISALKPEERSLLHLYYYEEIKVRQIAGILEVPVGTVKYRLHRIRKKLAVSLKEREDSI